MCSIARQQFFARWLDKPATLQDFRFLFECVEAFCDLVERWKPIGWAEEHGQISAGIGPFLERRMRERYAFIVRKPFAARGDKGERSDAVLRTAMAVLAQSIRGRMALEGFYIPAGSP